MLVIEESTKRVMELHRQQVKRLGFANVKKGGAAVKEFAKKGKSGTLVDRVQAILVR